MTQGQTISIAVRVAAPRDSILAVSVTNGSEVPLVVARSGLPWTNSYNLLLTAVRADAMGTVLERSLPVDDPLVGTLSIAPGETVSGEIDLERRFPTLAEARKQTDVLLYWSWRPQPIDEPPGPWTSGWLLLNTHRG